MDWGKVAYVLACLIVPVAWGLIVVWTSNWVEEQVWRRGRRKGRRRKRMRPIEYHI